uniref:Hyoscyamine 6 beta-hydroxylase n=1 Tax=Mandragora officinarum TaxID=33117 RepID=A0A6M6R352_MANOF|nr:hyoscyamine 6 beta-hydroxylase [Mandragora officinarum]
MTSVVSNWSTNNVSESFAAPLEKRAAKDVPLGNDIPIIDLQQDHLLIIQQISKACQDFGLFQVMNHGFPEKLMEETMEVCKEFFALPAEEKEKFQPNGEPAKFELPHDQKAKLYVEGERLSNEEFFYWKDTLAHGCYPLDEELVSSWPEKPATYREVVAKYSVEVRKLTMRILDYICEGLGLKPGYFDNELSQSQMMLTNYYPQCPDPSSTLAVGGHYDCNLITLLQQDLPGLQQLIVKDGSWIAVEPIPTAFVVNLGLTLKIITNESFKGSIHRVVTNPTRDRVSIGTFIGPDYCCTIEPAKELLSKDNPPLYKPYSYAEFFSIYLSDKSDYDAGVKPFKINA